MKRLSIDLNLVDLCATGFWFCRACQRVTERVDDDHTGMAHCAICRSPRIRWNPPVEFTFPNISMAKRP